VIDGWRYFGYQPAEGESDADMGRRHAEVFYDLLRGEGFAQRIHSRYQRRLTDLPLAGRPVRLVVVARRFRCVTVMCGRRIFTERFDDRALAPWARRTARLDLVVHHLGLALGGRPAASFARRLMLPVSNDTLLRVVRRRG
jgi:hypothetical protein